MPKTDRDRRTIRLSLSRLLGKPVRDSEIADALDLPASSYSRRKDKPDFPTFDEVRQLADRMGVDETVLLVDFGYLDIANLNSGLQERYAAYRNAIDVIESMRHTPQQPAAAANTATKPWTEGAADVEQPRKSGRPPRLNGARPIRSL